MVLTGYFDDHKMVPGHARRALRSGAVSILARAVNGAIQIGSVLFLARLLSPEDYGLVGMVAAVTGFAPVLVDLGTRDAIVQRSRIAEGEASALFWITLSLGSALALIVAASGPLIARFYGEPRLTAIAIVSSLTFVTSALTCQHYALLRRAMMFQELASIEVAANLLGAALAITIAFLGFHYWALVVRPIAATFLLAAGVWWQCRWLPSRPTLTGGVKEMLKFGLNLTGFTATDVAARSSDRVAIGYRIGATGLGFYQNALFVYDNLLEVLTGQLHGVAVAGLSKLRGDLGELRRLWAKALSTMTFFAMPAFGLLSVTAPDLIVLLLGRKWSNAGILLGVLALRGIPQSVERTLGWLHVTAGRTDRWMRWGVFAGGAQLLALLSGLPFGAMGVVTALVIAMFILFVPAIAYAGRPLGIVPGDVVRTVWRQVAGSLACAALGFLLRYSLLSKNTPLTRTGLLAVVYVVSYLAIVVGLLRLRSPIRTGLALCGEFLPSRLALFAGVLKADG